MEVGNRPIPGKEAPTVRYSHSGSVREQVGFLRRQFLQDGDLPFTDVLTEDVITQALAAVGGWLDRVFSPLVTLWVFQGQVLSADHSRRAAPRRAALRRPLLGGLLRRADQVRDHDRHHRRRDRREAGRPA